MAISSPSISKYTTILDIENSFLPSSLAKKTVPSLNLKVLEKEKVTSYYMGTSRRKHPKIKNFDDIDKTNNLTSRSKKISSNNSEENSGFLSLRTQYNIDVNNYYNNVSYLVKEKESEKIKEESRIFLQEPKKYTSSQETKTKFYTKSILFSLHLLNKPF